MYIADQRLSRQSADGGLAQLKASMLETIAVKSLARVLGASRLK